MPEVSQQRAIHKADVLIEALGWIRRFRDKLTVIKLGGSVMEDETRAGASAAGHRLLETVGMRVVVVHGGGAAISRAMDAAGLQPRFIQGRRYTDDATLDIVERILAYETNEALAGRDRRIRRPRHAAQFPHHECAFWRADARSSDDDGQPVDLGHVGRVTRRRPHDDRQPVLRRHGAGHSVDVPGRERQKLNVNADTAATAVAQALGAEKLVFLSDVNGVRLKKDDPDSLIHSLTADAGPRADRQRRDRVGHDPQSRSLPGNAR